MNKKYPLKIFAIISLVIIVVASIITGVFGIHSSAEIGGGKQITIKTSYVTTTNEKMDGREKVDGFVDKVKTVLSNHGTYIDSYFVEDKLTDTYLVVRIPNLSLKNQESIRVDIAEALALTEDEVSEVQNIDSYFSNKTMMFVGFALLAIIVVAFLIGVIRYGVLSGVSLLFAIMHNIIVSLAIIFLTRIQFSMIALSIILIFTILGTFEFIMILERDKENKKSKQYESLTESENMIAATKQNKAAIALAIIVLALSVAFICIPINHIRFAGLAMLVSGITAAYTFFGISPAICAALNEIRKTRQKEKLSTDVKPKKTK